MLAWAAGWPQRQFAVEGAHGLGRGIAQQLTAAGEHVLDVPATLAARVRLLSTGGGRKTDTHDAHGHIDVKGDGIPDARDDLAGHVRDGPKTR